MDFGSCGAEGAAVVSPLRQIILPQGGICDHVSSSWLGEEALGRDLTMAVASQKQTERSFDRR